MNNEQRTLDFTDEEGRTFFHYRSAMHPGNHFEPAHTRRFYLCPAARLYCVRAVTPFDNELLGEVMAATELRASCALSDKLKEFEPAVRDERQYSFSHFGFARS